nr:DDB1- and CUL4-associated factor 1 isoform X1 [Parasteatoda tepidariorum]
MSVEQVSMLLLQWEEENASGNVTEILERLALLFERETESFLKKDPDPFDDRHPSRLQPDCTLGHMLKTIFRNERIVDAIVKVYCEEDNLPLNTAACRLLLDILPGLESVIFEEEGFVPRLLHFVEISPNPLRSYATGLVAAAMECTEIASNFRERNVYFVPLMLKRLHEVSQKYLKTPPPNSNDTLVNSNRPFAAFKKLSEKRCVEDDSKSSSYKSPKKKRKNNDTLRNLRYSPILPEVKSGTSGIDLQTSPDESSNSKWNEMMIGSYSVFPLTLATEQRYILQYLTPMGEYQELIGHIFESNALLLILRYIDIRQNPDVRLAFEALKYLASLLVHKKIAIEFLSIGGLKYLLKVPYPSIAATGVSICLYYFSYTEEVMEKICMLSSSDIAELVSYALYLLEGSHDSSRCHATMFFGFAFAFKIILQHFNEQDGLRKLFNVMSTLDIFASRNTRTLSDDQVFANRQTTRHVCAALKRYFEAHLASEIENVSSPCNSDNQSTRLSKHKAMNLSYKSIENYIEHWHELLGPMVSWRPVDEFLQFDGVSFLLELTSDYFSTSSYSGRAETVKNALDVLKVCSLSSATQLAFCEKVNTTEYVATTGITVLLAAAEGELLPVAEIQKSALQTIINCVCTKIENETERRTKKVEELLSKLCENVRIKNGIMTLINLLSTKTPLTDADAIRALACKALCGLARSTHVKQIISKLRIITDGELLHLMKEPVLSDKSEDHLHFVKYSLELIEKVTGAPVSVGSESSMLNINKSEIVAKTKIVYNEAQLMQLICEHLIAKGFTETAAVLQKEMKDKNIFSQPSSLFLTSLACRNSPKSMTKRSTMPSSPHTPISFSSSNSVPTIPPPSVPLRIVVTKKTPAPEYKSPISSRLQKPIQACSRNFFQTPAMKRQNINFSHESEPGISLHSIITEYLRKHHSLCRNPMLACPPFDLFTPHKCPEPQNRRNAPINCVNRIYKKQIYHKHGGIGGSSLDLKCIYNKFRFVRAYRDAEGDCDFSCCSFFNYDSERRPRILVGTDGRALGELKVFNLNSGDEEISKNSHFRGLSHIESSNLAPLILTSDGGRIGNSSLWKLEEDLEVVRQFNEISHVEFGKRSHLKIVGTKHDSAVIIDTNSGSEIIKFLTRDLGNSYPSNRATFDYSDELVLTDGIIFDSRNGLLVHKLDKFNSIMNGVFHPNGREIISNTEIWDIRTFKLLKTVAGLEYCRPTFNPNGKIIYGVFCYKDAPDERTNCFYTFDASDYSSIATVDVKRPVFELSADFNERYVATIESQSVIATDPFNPPLRGLDCVCRLYEIGRSKEDGDEDNEESDDTEEETEDDEEVDEIEGDNEASGRDVEDILFELDNEQELDSDGSSSSSETLFSLNTSMED